MANKPVLHYFNGRGRMESIRWLLAAAGVEFEEQLFETKEQLERLGAAALLFRRVPMVEVDGMGLVQSRAILHCIAEKCGLLGKDIKERAKIVMYSEGTMDLMELVLKGEEQEKGLTEITKEARTRYFPVYEKVLKTHGQNFLVGNQMSLADVQLIEAILMMEELVPDALSGFPLLQEFRTRMSNIPKIEKFLAPGSKRKPMTDAKLVEKVMKTFHS